MTCLFFMDSAAMLMLNWQQLYLFGQIQTSQTGGQPYNDTSPYGQYSLGHHLLWPGSQNDRSVFNFICLPKDSMVQSLK